MPAAIFALVALEWCFPSILPGRPVKDAEIFALVDFLTR
jgi:hypothetical protein